MLEIETLCKKKLRLTKQLRIVLHVIFNSTDHPTVDQVYDRAALLSKSISKATVYRCVKKLVELSIVQKHDFGLGKFHYEIASRHHHHLIDTVSGKIIEFHSKELEDLKEKIVRDLGFKLVDHRLDMYVAPLDNDGDSSDRCSGDESGESDISS